MKIKLSDIAIINRQRRSMEGPKVAELAASIRDRGGLIQPIVVRRPIDDDEHEAAGGRPFVLSVGGRRMAAHVLLKWDEIEAIVKENLTDPVEIRLIELEENLKRENISWDDEVAARKEVYEILKERDPEMTFDDAAAIIGISKAQLSKDLNIATQIAKDPQLKAAPTKGSAIRAVGFKDLIDAKIQHATKTIPAAITDIRNKLHTADGRAFIRTIPSQSVDLVFSDLPYGIDYFEGLKGADEHSQGHYDDHPETAKDFIADIVPECLRVVKPKGWVVFFMCYEWHQWLQELCHDTCIAHHSYRHKPESDWDNETPWPTCDAWVNRPNPTKDDKPPCSWYRPELPPWIWTRRGRGNHGHWPELHASNRYELIVVVNGGSAVLAKKPVENVLDFPPFSGERLHAMQKPHELCREIIERTTVPGELVLDICFGSGAHLAAAASLGRAFLGCDSNPRNLDSAVSLVSQHFHRTSGGPRKVEEPSLELLK